MEKYYQPNLPFPNFPEVFPEKEEASEEKMPEIEVTTGLKGWAGEMPEAIMKNGNISNISYPYIAFDFECLLYVPQEFRRRVNFYEKFPFKWLNKKAIQYYRTVPKAMDKLIELMKVDYNIAIVYVGPEHLWKQKEQLLEPFPYTTLICVSDPISFKEHVTLNSKIIAYYSLSQIKVNESGGKGILFQDWVTLGLEKRG